MVRVMALGLLCVCFAACNHRHCAVKIIVPDGFQGGICAIFDEPAARNGTQVVPSPIPSHLPEH